MIPATCIYCRAQDKPFNREHVIPESFGTFEQNLVLHDCVCIECNRYFGDKLEPLLARGSSEGILRWKHGVKSYSEADKLQKERVSTTVESPGDWRGARARLIKDPAEEKFDADPLPQVGFRKPDYRDWVWLTEEELDEKAVGPYRGSKAEIKITGPSEEDWNRLREKLKSLGIDFQEKKRICSRLSETGQVAVRCETPIDEPILRCVAKIAFNYVAYVHRTRFVLLKDFDDIRGYIRYGRTPPWSPLIHISRRPILGDDSLWWRQTNGHLITFDWNAGGQGLFAQVSLFNSATYMVVLCPRYHGLWQDLRSGHHFDIDARTVSELRCASRELML